MDDLLRAGAFVDLYRVVQQGFVIGTPSYSLKEVEHLYMPQRTGPVQRRGRYLPQSVAHPARMLPAIAAHAVAAYTEPGDLVFDPMAGIGTTIVEAIHAGRDGIGIEYESRWSDIADANVAHALSQGATGRGSIIRGDATRMAALLPAALTGQVAQSGLTVLNTIAVLILTPVVAFYLLLDWSGMVKGIDDLLPREHRREIRQLLDQIDRSIAGVIRGQGSVILVLCVYYATALTLTRGRALDTTLSQNAMRFHGRIGIDAHYNGLALDASEGERIAHAMQDADVAFLGNHGVIVCGERVDYAYDDLYYLERACMIEVLAASTGRPLVPVDAALARRVAEQTNGERLQSELFFASLRRTLGAAS